MVGGEGKACVSYSADNGTRFIATVNSGTEGETVLNDAIRIKISYNTAGSCTNVGAGGAGEGGGASAT